MFIIDLSEYESDFCLKTTMSTGAKKVRTFDIDCEYAMSIYEYINQHTIVISRYGNKTIEMDFWEKLKSVKVLYPNIHLEGGENIRLNNEGTKMVVEIKNKNTNRLYD